jgi:hypothetical protein
MLVANPGDDSAVVILHNHYTFVLDLAYRANADLAPIPPPSFVEDKAKTMIDLLGCESYLISWGVIVIGAL